MNKHAQSIFKNRVKFHISRISTASIILLSRLIWIFNQSSRIVIINMLRESLQIEQICELISVTSATLYDDSDDIIKDDHLYHKCVDMLCDENLRLANHASIEAAADRVAAEFDDSLPVPKKQLSGILQVMAYAHFASVLKKRAQDILVDIK